MQPNYLCCLNLVEIWRRGKVTRRPRFRHKAEYDFCERKKERERCMWRSGHTAVWAIKLRKSLLLLPKPRAYGARGKELNRCPLPLAHPIPLKPEMEPGIR